MNERFPGIIGHSEALSRIPLELPPVLLLRGPEGVGKFRIALALAREVAPDSVNRQIVPRLTRMSVDTVREFHSYFPLMGEHKASVINFDGSLLNGTMLNLLEDPPPYSRFLLHASTQVPVAVQSRAHTIQFGALSIPEVSMVLERLGKPSAEAARDSCGNVSRALSYAENQTVREDVERLLEALAQHDRGLTRVLTERALEVAPEVACACLSRRLSMTGNPSPVVQDALDVLSTSARPVLRFKGAIRTLSHGGRHRHA